ncbi:MAG: FAD-dependent oxidoreductase [Acetobacteraceae bacterium]|nr:FAD-dependent oxidoreductase [Acetobacteraceae bacterium]
MADPDIVIIGAGTAGLAAAAHVRQAGRSCIVLEASARIGGRAWTTFPAALGGAPFDQGAIWLHTAERNPLAVIARAAGETLHDANGSGRHQTWMGDRFATKAEEAAYRQSTARYNEIAAALTRPGLPDVPLAEVAGHMVGDPWAATIEMWEGPIIAAAPANAFSLQDWQRNSLAGGNLRIETGMGDFVRRRLGPPAGEVARLTPAERIDWKGKRIVVDTKRGSIQAASCVITVSTGVLASGAIEFTPALPCRVQECIAALPMGMATRVALRAAGSDRLGLPSFSSVDRWVADSHEPAAVFIFWPFGRDHVAGWIGHPGACALAREGPGAAEAFARAELQRILGPRAQFAPKAVVTRWAEDVFVRGAYAYATVGNADARRRLAEPLDEGRLVFAGEACHEGLAGTLAGAYLSGIGAAGAAIRASDRVG